MELKRRFIQNHSQEDKEATEEQNEDSVVTFDADDNQDKEPGIPSRKILHGKPQKKANKLALGYTLSILAIVSVLGGSGWWMKSQISQTATPVLTQEGKKLEPNKEMRSNEVPKQAGMADTASKEQKFNTTVQPPEQKLPTESSSVVPQPSQAVQTSKPIKVQKAVPKPVYTKILRHKVGAGETLYRISLKYYYTGRHASFLGKYNRIGDPANLISGALIKIPFPPGK